MGNGRWNGETVREMPETGERLWHPASAQRQAPTRKMRARGERAEEREMKCPKCGHEFPAPQQSAAGQSRWSGVSRETRAALALKGWRKRRKTQAPPKRANTELTDRRGAGSVK